MTDEQIFEVERYRRRRYSSRDICKLVGIDDGELQKYIGDQKLKQVRGGEYREPDPTPEELAERVAYYKARQLANLRKQGPGEFREREPRHYCVVRELNR